MRRYQQIAVDGQLGELGPRFSEGGAQTAIQTVEND